jgi:hypothetical protein
VLGNFHNPAQATSPELVKSMQGFQPTLSKPKEGRKDSEAICGKKHKNTTQLMDGKL